MWDFYPFLIHQIVLFATLIPIDISAFILYNVS